MNNGFILLHRKFLKWEWYSNINDRLVFIHCLLSANWEDGWFEGVKIPRGSFATSYKNLAKEIGISVHQLRTSLNHLKLTHNVAHETNKQFSIITINNYDKYQLSGTPSGKRVANEWQTSGNNIINNNERNKEKENNNIYIVEIIDHLNLRTGQHYKSTTQKTRDLIKARLNEKFTIDDFKVVIDKMCVEWMNTDMQKYLRPETLFGTKFESYLNREVKQTTKNITLTTEEIENIFG